MILGIKEDIIKLDLQEVGGRNWLIGLKIGMGGECL